MAQPEGHAPRRTDSDQAEYVAVVCVQRRVKLEDRLTVPRARTPLQQKLCANVRSSRVSIHW